MFREYDRDYIDYASDYDEYTHDSQLPNISRAKDFMKNVFAVLYGDLSIDNLETNLEEVCAVLGMNLPSTKLTIMKP
jgi:hypothetical protein